MGDAAQDNESVHASGGATAGEPPDLVGWFYTWWRDDSLPALSPVPDLAAAPGGDEQLVATMMGTDVETVRERMRQGHRPWLARIGDKPVGWGWVAASEAAIAELGIAINLPSGDRYLWDFVTQPSWRGRGVYAALLQAILAQEGAARYWIGHDVGNIASVRGITNAGFRVVGAVRRMEDGHVAFVPDGSTDRAEAAATLLGLPVTDP